MKKIAILVAALMAATAAFSAVNIQWGALAFLSGNDSGAPDRELEEMLFATSDAEQIVWDLVWTSMDSLGSYKPTLNKEDGSISYAEGTMEVWSRRTWTGGEDLVVDDLKTSNEVSETPLKFNTDFATIEEGAINYINKTLTGSGNLYAAVFQYCSNGDGTTSVFYSLSDLNTSVNWNNEKDAATDVSFSWDEPTALGLLGTYGTETVPEPATMSLMGLGALAMVLRRKFRK